MLIRSFILGFVFIFNNIVKFDVGAIVTHQ